MRLHKSTGVVAGCVHNSRVLTLLEMHFLKARHKLRDAKIGAGRIRNGLMRLGLGGIQKGADIMPKRSNDVGIADHRAVQWHLASLVQESLSDRSKSLAGISVHLFNEPGRPISDEHRAKPANCGL